MGEKRTLLPPAYLKHKRRRVQAAAEGDFSSSDAGKMLFVGKI